MHTRSSFFSHLSTLCKKKPVYKCRNEYKKKTKQTPHLPVVFCRTYTSLDSTFKLPIASFTGNFGDFFCSGSFIHSIILVYNSKEQVSDRLHITNFVKIFVQITNPQEDSTKFSFKAVEYFRFCEAIVAKLIPREQNSL